MNEQTETKGPSAEYLKFLECVKATGAYASRLDDPTGDKKITEWYVPKDAAPEIHGITDDNLIQFRPLTRDERRRVFKKNRLTDKLRAINLAKSKALLAEKEKTK
jgi:hypothetical protein